MFGRDGLAGASMAAVAERAAISRPALYELYPSKQKLYDVVLAEELGRFTAALVATYEAPAATPRARIRQRYAAVFDFAVANPDAFALLSRSRDEAAGVGRRRMARTSVVSALSDRMRQEFAQIDYPTEQLPDVLAWLFFALGEAAARGALANGSWDRDALIDLVTDMTGAVFTAVDRRVLDAVDTPRRGRRRT